MTRNNTSAWSIPLLLVLIPITSGNARGSLLPYLKLSDLMMLILFAFLVTSLKPNSVILDKLGIAILIFVVIGLVTAVFNLNQRIILSSDLIAKSLLSFPQYLLAYTVGFWSGQKTLNLKRFVYISLVLGSIISAIAVFQFLNYSHTREILSLYTGNLEINNFPKWKTYRPTSIFYSWHALSMFLAINFAMGLSILRFSSKKISIYLLLLANLIGVLASLTFTPMILCLIALIRLRILKLYKVIMFIFTLISVSKLFSLNIFSSISDRIERQLFDQSGTFHFIPQTIRFRFHVWSDLILPDIKANFWDGFGFSEEGSYRYTQYTESLYFYLLLSGGIFLLIGFMFVQLRTLQSLSANLRIVNDPLLFEFTISLRIVATFLIISSLLHPYLTDTGPAFLFFILVGGLQGSLIKEKNPVYEK